MKIAKNFAAYILVAVLAALTFTAIIYAATLPVSEQAEAEPVAVVSVMSEELDNEDVVAALSENQNDASAEADATGSKALAAGIAIGLAALGGALGMGIAISKSVDGIARQPEASGNIRSTMMLGLVFIETVVIYALIVSVLLIFVL